MEENGKELKEIGLTSCEVNVEEFMEETGKGAGRYLQKKLGWN